MVDIITIQEQSISLCSKLKGAEPRSFLGGEIKRRCRSYARLCDAMGKSEFEESVAATCRRFSFDAELHWYKSLSDEERKLADTLIAEPVFPSTAWHEQILDL